MADKSIILIASGNTGQTFQAYVACILCYKKFVFAEQDRKERRFYRVNLRQMFNKGLCHLKFGGRIRHTKENDVDSYDLYRDDDADGLLIRDGELLEFDGLKTTESGTVYTVGTSESGKQIYLTEKEYGMLMPC